MRGYSSDHHAHIVDLNGNVLEDVLDHISGTIEEHHTGYVLTGLRFLYDSLLIEHVRDIISTQATKNRKGEHRLILIGFNSSTREAQNALLKALEEPTRGTSFVLLVPNTNILLKTIRSRCISLTLEMETEGESSFLRTPLKERLELVKKLLENKRLLGRFYVGLEQDIEAYIKAKNVRAPGMVTLNLPLKYKHAILGQSPSSKYLLEEIALTLPLIQEL